MRIINWKNNLDLDWKFLCYYVIVFDTWFYGNKIDKFINSYYDKVKGSKYWYRPVSTEYKQFGTLFYNFKIQDFKLQIPIIFDRVLTSIDWCNSVWDSLHLFHVNFSWYSIHPRFSVTYFWFKSTKVKKLYYSKWTQMSRVTHNISISWLSCIMC